MPKVVYVGAHDEALLSVEGRDVIVTRGQPVEFPAAIVGRAPSARWDELQAELVDAYAALDHHRIRRLLDELIDADPGVGLLAQPANWQPAAAPKVSAKSSKDGE